MFFAVESCIFTGFPIFTIFEFFGFVGHFGKPEMNIKNEAQAKINTGVPDKIPGNDPGNIRFYPFPYLLASQEVATLFYSVFAVLSVI